MAELGERHGGRMAKDVCSMTFFSIYFTREPLLNYRSMASNNRALAHRVFLALLNEGYALSPGLMMNSLSLPMERGQIDGLVSAMARALDQATI